jgi:hypothetical protein
MAGASRDKSSWILWILLSASSNFLSKEDIQMVCSFLQVIGGRNEGFNLLGRNPLFRHCLIVCRMLQNAE